MTHKEKQDRFVAMIKEHERLILRVCAMYTNCGRADLRDLYQDAVCALWESYDTFKGNSKISTWIYSVTRYTMLNYMRSHRVEMSSVCIDEMPERGVADETERLLDDVREALTLLPPEDRDLFVMWMEGFDNEEIGQVVGLRPGNVAVRITRIKKKIRKIVNGEGRRIRL